MKKSLHLLTIKTLALFCGIILTTSAYSQSINLTGTVQNVSNTAISDVKVTLKSHATITTNTNATGNFTLTGTITGISVSEENKSISFGANGLVLLNLNNEPVRTDIFNVSGQLICTILNEGRMNGLFQINASAYVPQDLNIYIVRVMVGEKVKSNKFISGNSNASRGLIEISSGTVILKDATAVSDSLILTHKDYKTKKVLLSSYTGNLGTITMEAVTTAPTIPGSLTTTAASSAQINLSWTDSNYETSFSIERAPGGTTNFVEIATVGSDITTYQNTGLTSSTSYVYRIRASNSVGYSDYSNPSTTTTQATPATAPAAPTVLTSTAISSSQINLSWTDNSNNETLFSIERAPGGTTSFTEIATVSAGVSTYQNTGLTASTSYVYRVRAYNSAGYSVYTNSPTATTQALPAAAPTAPTSLTATVASSVQINLSWTDNSNNETLFSIERAPGGTTSFAEIATVGAGITTYQNTGLSASTSYDYRVRANNSAGYSGYSNTANAKTNDATTYSLSVSVSPPCAGTATMSPSMTAYPQGTVVTITYNANPGFAISSWTGDATGTANSVQVTMNGNKSISANAVFSHVGPVLSSSGTTGNFNLNWTFTWPAIGSSQDHLEIEQSTTSASSGFSIIYTSTNGSSQPTTLALTRTAGTYYYRIRAYMNCAYTSYSSVVTVTVQNQVATVRVQNSTKYDMISIKLNNVEQLQYKYVLPIGNTEDYTFTTGGTVSYTIVVGLMDSNGNTTDFFTFTNTVQAIVGQVVTINCVNPTLAQMLSVFSSSKKWSGYYFDANSNYHTCGYTFYSDGSFQLYDGTTLIGTGTATLVTWADRATIISFKLGTTETIQMMYPFGSFMQSNGPASWKVITYTQQ
jgi:hypothetical protein